MKPTIRLIHWNAEEAAPRAAQLQKLGYTVDAAPVEGWSLGGIRETQPAAVVIDLTRMQSHGREFGMAMRLSKVTRLIPIVFVEGPPDKVQRTMELLPDARYTTYEKLGPVLEDVLKNPPKEAVVPKSLSGPNSPVPLVKKLGAKDAVALIDAPEGFETKLAGLKIDKNAAMALWFITTPAALAKALPKMKARAEKGNIWIIWPKGLKNGINGNVVRESALAYGLVDFKICAVDETWSGMRFAPRRTD
jgi:CheY-like chemotaxis protein